MENKNDNLGIVREFKHEDKVYKVCKPSTRVTTESRLKQSAAFTKALREGLYTRKKLERELRDLDPDLFGTYYTDRDSVAKEMEEIESMLNTARESQDLEQLKTLSSLLTLYRAQIVNYDYEINSLFSNTADQIGEEERLSFIASKVILDSNSNSVWKSYEDFLACNDTNFTETCKYQVLCYEYGIDPEWREKLPEEEALKLAEKLEIEKQRIKKEQEEKEKEQEEKESENISEEATNDAVAPKEVKKAPKAKKKAAVTV